MNKIYSNVWNKSLGQLVVASELAHQTGKSGGRAKGTKRAAAVAAAALLISLPFAGMAQTYNGVGANGTPHFGNNQGIFVNDGTDGGCTEYNDWPSQDPSDTIASFASGFNLCQPTDKNVQTARALFYNGSAYAGSNSLTLGGELFVNGGRLGLTDQGTSVLTSTQDSQGNYTITTSYVAPATYSMRIGSAATMGYTLDSKGNLTYGSAIPGKDSIAIGSAESSTGFSKTAGNTGYQMGAPTIAAGQSAIAIGSAATASNNYGIAIGSTAKATNVNDVALGAGSSTGNISTGSYTVIAGSTTVAGTPKQASGVVSVGSSGNERQIQNVAAGTISSSSTNAVNGSQLYAVGNQVNANTTNLGNVATALGNGTTYTTWTAPSYMINGTTYTNVGSALAAATTHYYSVNSAATGNYNDNGATGSDAIAAGVNASAAGNYALAVGNNASAVAQNDTAIGPEALAGVTNPGKTDDQSIALGAVSTATGNQSTALGNDAFARGNSSVAIGGDDLDLVAGETYTAIVNGKSVTDTGANLFTDLTGSKAIQVGAYYSPTAGDASVALGPQAMAGGTNAGTNQDTSAFKPTGEFDVAIGAQAQAEGFSSIALGTGAQATADTSFAIGPNAQATAASTLAIGTSARANQANALAIGTGGTNPNTYTQATGLGATAIGGDATAGANAAGTNAIAIGGQTHAANANAVAVGDGATANDQNDVALGADSSTTAPHAGNYTINGGTVAGTEAANSTDGVVSVGSGGKERQIQNVAAGVVSASSTDAINGSQLYTVGTATNNVGSGAATALGGGATYTPGTGTWKAPSYTVYGTPVSNVGTAITDLQTQAPVQYSSSSNPAKPSNPQTPSNDVTLVGSTAGSPVGLHNVASGQVTATSTDAVNGSQLYATGQAITALGTNVTNLGNSTAAGLGGGSTYDPTTGKLTTSLNVGGATYTSVDAALNAVNSTASAGWNVTTSATGTGVANGSSVARVASGQTATITAGNNIITTQNGTDVAIGVNPVLTGLTSVTTGDSTLDNAGLVVNNGTNSTTYGATGMSIANGPSVTTAGIDAGNEKITNVAPGTLSSTSTDAVNGSQLYATNQKVSNIENGKAGPFQSDNSVTSTAPVASGANATAGGFGASATGANSTVVGNGATDNGNAGSTVLGEGASIAASTKGSNVALGQGSTVASAAVPTASGTIDGTTYQYAGGTPAGVVSVGSAGHERQIANVAAGQVTATSTDAVNGSQLYATDQAITALGTNVTNLGNSTAAGLGGGSTYDPTTGKLTTSLNVGGATYTSVDAALNAVNSTASAGWNVTTSATGTGVANGSSVARVASGQTATITAGNNIITTQNGTDVAIGVNPVLTGLTSVTATNSSGGSTVMNGGGVTVTAGSTTTTYGANGMTIANGPSVTTSGIDAGGQKITNVAAGTAPTDAANVGQLNAVSADAVHYDTNPNGTVNYNSVTLNPNGSATTIHNVAAGTAPTDAANVGQLEQGMSSAENWSKSYTDQEVNQMGNKAFGGVASAIAVASLPQAYAPDQNEAGVALGNFHGQSAIAVGVSAISQNGRWIFKASATDDTRGDAGVGVGAGIVW